jgi:hypothetical protein
MVGIVSGPFFSQPSSGSAIEYSSPGLIGVAEGSPTAVVVAYTGTNVAQVRMDFAKGGSDQMTPVQGWSALTAPFAGGVSSSGYGTLTALDKSGHVVATETVGPTPQPYPLGVPPKPGVLPSNPGNGAPTPAAGGGTVSPSGSGYAGSGSASRGSASSNSAGAVASPPATIVSPPASTTPATLVYPCTVQTLPGVTPPLPGVGGGASTGSGASNGSAGSAGSTGSAPSTVRPSSGAASGG